jgi:dTDP-4-dehydrorhamnose 3,5-epimerase
MELRLNLLATRLSDVFIAETNFISDNRGAFARLYCKDKMAHALQGKDIVQVNFSFTESSGAVRGMHFQHPPYTEMKFVRCIKGRIWDVVVDLREDSPTFMDFHAEELSQDNAKMIVIPEGCAHGFQTLEAKSELLYLHTEYYTPDAEDGIAYNDPLLNIVWPLPISEVSIRDQGFSRLTRSFSGIKL